VVFVVGVAAALSLGLGYVLQQRVAAQASASRPLSYWLLWWLMHKRVWWAGIGAMVAGQLLGGWALHLASVALVEPLLSTSLLFAFAFAAMLSKQSVRWFEVVGALLLSASLGVFIAVGNPHSSPNPEPNRAVIVLAVCLVAAVVVVLVSISRTGRLLRRSVLLASAAGLLYGLQDASTRAVLTDASEHGVLAVLHSHWSLVVVAAATVGIVLSQSAFNAARLDLSLPPITAAEPVAGIALGVSLLGDVVSVTAAGLAVECICLVAMLGGIVLIARSRTLSDC
jgi:drug/metabolite transporter (DMT)-like permease